MHHHEAVKEKNKARLLGNGTITDENEHKKLDLFKYQEVESLPCIRHSAITADLLFSSRVCAEKEDRWSMNSKTRIQIH